MKKENTIWEKFDQLDKIITELENNVYNSPKDSAPDSAYLTATFEEINRIAMQIKKQQSGEES